MFADIKRAVINKKSIVYGTNKGQYLCKNIEKDKSNISDEAINNARNRAFYYGRNSRCRP